MMKEVDLRIAQLEEEAERTFDACIEHSEPLRERIAKLEAQIKLGRDLIQVAWPSDIADKALWERKKIEWLKGLVDLAVKSQ